MIARVVLNEDYQPNILIPNFDNERKLAKIECVCSNNCYGQFPEDEMYSI